MASPIKYYILPQCQFKIDCGEEFSGVTNPNDLHVAKKYTLAIPDDAFPGHCVPAAECYVQGIMSPINDVTLPPYGRGKAGIHNDAEKYAFIHPPPSLAEYLKYNSLTPEATTSYCNKEDLKWQISMFAVFGGFVYFNKEMQAVAVNVVTPFETNYKLRLAGPFSTPIEVIKDMRSLGRLGTIPLEVFHEAGYVAKGWVRPGETFQSEPATHDFDCSHGALIFYSDNGAAMTYAVTGGMHVDPMGDFNSLADTFDTIPLEQFFSSSTFSSKCVTFGDEKQWQQAISLFLEGKTISFMDLGSSKNFLHNSIKAKCSLADIEKIFDLYGEEELTIQDEYGWSPLHYACRFTPNDCELIRMLVKKNVTAVLMADKFNRYPLHLACDSGASYEIIKLLLDSDIKGEVVLESTLNLQRLPLHIACSRGVQKDVVDALLEADYTGRTVRSKTKTGRLALHLAIEKKLDEEVIASLLRADSKLNDSELNSNDDDIYQEYRGMLPLHYACLVHHNKNIVKLLIKKDQRNTTLYQRISLLAPAPPIVTDIVRSKSHDEKSALVRGGIRTVLSEESAPVHDPNKPLFRSVSRYTLKLEGVRALHLSTGSNSLDTTRLLLQKEKLGQMSVGKRQEKAVMVDMRGRTCLHLACMQNMEPDVIKLLLGVDPSRITTTMGDRDGCRPLHLACNHKTARKDVIEILLDAEKEHYNQKKEHDCSLSTSVANAHGKNPLCLAIKAEAPCDVLELLFQPTYFDTTGFDGISTNLAARRTQVNGSLQRSLNRVLSQRTVFMLLIFGLLVNALALTSFFLAIEDLLYGNVSQTFKWTFWTLLACTVVFCFLEVTQMRSQKSLYFVDSRNAYQLSIIGLLIWSLNYIGNHVGAVVEYVDKDVDKVLMMIGGVLLSGHMVFSLRSTFLPFAKFASGVCIIFVTLIPFFIVSWLTLLMFAFLFRTWYQDTRCTDETNAMCSNCKLSYKKCFYGVLGGFFSGPEGTQNELDIIYGVVIVIVLLNVVIAIVSDAWEDAKDRASFTYWRGRLSFLSESRALINSFDEAPSRMKGVLNWIDSAAPIMEEKHFSWSNDFPYNKVHSKKQYEDPFHYFIPAIAEVIKGTHSLQSDLHWIRSDPEHYSEWQKRKMSSFAVGKWLWCSLLYFALVILGFPTLGLLWPSAFRFQLLSCGNNVNNEDEVTEMGDFSKKVDAIANRLDVMMNANCTEGAGIHTPPIEK